VKPPAGLPCSVTDPNRQCRQTTVIVTSLHPILCVGKPVIIYYNC